jgi:hypothetical protein
MELRTIAFITGVYVLTGRLDNGSTVTIWPISVCTLANGAALANALASASDGCITYNSTNHDPFDS